MTKPKKRLSAGMALPPDGVDPLFEFDVARLFVDLAAATSASAMAASGHDVWFDLVHDDHSRPTEEFVALSQDEMKRRQQSDHATTTTAASSSHTTTATTAASRSKEVVDTDGEKENRNARATVGRGRGGGLGGSARTGTGPAGRSRMTAPALTAPRLTGLKRPLAGRSKPLGQIAQSSGNTATSAATTGNTLRSSAPVNPSTMHKKRPISERSAAYRPTASSLSKSTAHSKGPSSSNSDLQELQALLAKHNKKFKSAHTYEPRQHSVRDVRTWEQQNNKSYYTLSSDERLQANEEIAALVRQRLEVSGAT
ncbi:hypothetical protein PINS_up005675 [Pythium insidiosum]|nr:hypothetical protein PINS_up005675 [Pythium insidiosum]